jgi:hypothetical protein
MLILFQHLVIFLLSADTPFIPVHGTGFSGVQLINQFTRTPLRRRTGNGPRTTNNIHQI